MNEAMREYLDAMGAPELLLSRIELLIGAYVELLPESIAAHFVSEYLDEADQRTFESLWLFSDHFAMEAKLLGADEDQFDFVPHKSGVRHVVVRKRGFDLREADSGSRMSIEVWFADQRYGILKATGANCEALTAILRDHLLPNSCASDPSATSPS